MSSPNQKMMIIHKPKYRNDFLQIGLDEWCQAANISGDSKSVLITYLYLASNSDNFKKDFSPADMVKLFGKSERTWERALKTLIDEKYVVHLEGDPNNKFHFYTTPQRKEELKIDYKLKDFARMDEIEQQQIYEAILELDWEDMTEDQIKIHDYYVENILE